LEKYEVNKFIEEYKNKLNDLFQAFNIENKRIELDKLNKEIESEGFWNDPEKAQNIISKANAIKDVIKDYDNLKNKFDDIISNIDDAFSDESIMELVEEMIDDFKSEENEIEKKALLSGKYDMNNCIIEFHPGAGGTESMDWALMLFRLYQRYCQKKGFKFNIVDYQPGIDAGIKSATVLVSGNYAYGMLKSERGVHRLVRISPFDSNARRHTSFCSIDVAPEIEEADDIVINDDDIRVDTYLSSGHGGQGVNTTYSAVRITHLPTNIVVTCQNERSQLKNKATCLKVLKSKLLEIELKKQEEEMRKLKGEQMGINFGSQIRSYVFTPYTLVKDHRTSYETANLEAVMNGDIDEFIEAYLKFNARGE
jgi:peptide chain release factor 2